MKQDSMVVEYRGDLLRPKMSDDRQKLYNRIGKDCYLFNVNDDVVIDATMTGAVGRFTVSLHPLMPNPACHSNTVGLLEASLPQALPVISLYLTSLFWLRDVKPAGSRA